MKTVVRLMLVVVLLALAVPLFPAGAQDGGEEDELLAPEMSAIYFQTADGGSFVDNGDGTYTLTLEGVGAEITWIMTEPTLAVQTINNTNFNAHWNAAEGLVTDAVLGIEGFNIHLTLSMPTYDEATGVQTFVATVNQIVPAVESKDEPELPMTFDSAKLSIAWTVDFQSGLVLGVNAMYEGMRATPEECAAAQKQWNDYLTWDAAKKAEYIAARNTCRGRDGTTDAALKQTACQLSETINAERLAASASITPVTTLLGTECTSS
jgi:hypothetical protein